MIRLRGIYSLLFTTWIFCQQTHAQSQWSEWGHWSVCSASCFGGEKTRTRACQSPGQCIGPNKERSICETDPCFVTHCPDISSNAHGDVITSSAPPYKVGTTARFTCDRGYRGTGVSSITCKNNGKWSNKIPSCTETHCPDISPNAHGDVITSSAPPYKVGTTARFNCETGFRVTGVSSITCMNDGEWSDKIPSCTTIKDGTHCPDISPNAHGDIITSSESPYKVGTTANFTCDSGFKRIGVSRITCMDDGEWSNKIPFCTPSVCVRDLKQLAKGRKCAARCRKDGSCKNNFDTCQCDDFCGKSCFNKNAKCVQLTKPKNGEIIIRGRRYGQTVTYKCKPGYMLLGPSSRTCRSDRKWSEYDPYCVPFSACGFTEKKTAITARVVHGTDAKNGDWPWQVALIRTASYSVEQMYRNSVVGGGSVITEEWVLSAANVFSVSFEANVKSNSWNDSFLIVFGMESVVQRGFDIPEHIQIFEPEKVILHPKFNWKNLDYDVALIRVGKRLKRGTEDRFIIDTSSPGGKVTFSRFVRPVCLPCMRGNNLKPANVRKNFDKDRCYQNETSILPSFADTGSKVFVTGFGIINYNSNELPDSLQEGQITIVDPLTCARDIRAIRRGYKYARYTKRMFCASGGSEQKKVDACQGDSGGPAVKKMRLKENKLVKYWMQIGIVSWGSGCASKYHGYYTSVPSVMNWVWKTLDDDGKGQWSEWGHWSVCSASCDGGTATRTRACETPGQCFEPNKEKRICETTPCVGQWSEWGHWGVCSASCDGGNATRTRACKSPGQCIGPNKEKSICETNPCPETHCPDISPYAHGDIMASSESPYKVGTTAAFTCDRGFRRTGVSNITCMNDGEWSDKIPSCTASVCVRDIGQLEKGRNCQVRCRKNGLCKNSIHTCQCDDFCGKSCFNKNAKCGQLKKPKNGEIIIRGRRYGQTVTYKCKSGYTLLGPSSRTCRSDRKWSEYDPYCVPFSACGLTEKKTANTARVVHGTDAKKGDWPWQVALIRTASYSVEQMYKNSVFGGGSVITEEWVLSAASVFSELFEENVKSKSWNDSFLIVFGMESVIQRGFDIPEHFQIFEPEKVILHSKFNRKNFDYDVALIRVGKRLKRGTEDKFAIDTSSTGGKVTFSRFVRPVCLPCMKGNILKPANVWKNFDKVKCYQKEKSILPSFAATGSKVVVTGYGAANHDTRELPRNLQEGQIKIIDPLICARDVQDIKRQNRDARYTKTMFCASGWKEKKKVDSCQGDIGGPVVKKMRLKENKLVNYWMQLGIVSWGMECASKYHGYYASVPSVMNWVWRILDDDRKDGWTEWSLWSKCSVICGGGEKSRTRSCLRRTPCIGREEKKVICNTMPCQWSVWGHWSVCSASCNGGKARRTRACERRGQCFGPKKDKRICETNPCHGIWLSWGSWSKCSLSCGNGQMTRTRICQGPGLCIGKDEAQRDCNTGICPTYSECGQAGDVIHGSNAKRWPWHVLIVESTEYDNYHEITQGEPGFKSGSLINNEWVLGSVDVYEQNVAEKSYLIFAGATTLPKANEVIPNHVQVFKVGSIAAYLNGSLPDGVDSPLLIRIGKKMKSSGGNKFVIDKINANEKFSFSPYVRPVCLPCVKKYPSTPNNTMGQFKERCKKTDLAALIAAGSRAALTGFSKKRPYKLEGQILQINNHFKCLRPWFNKHSWQGTVPLFCASSIAALNVCHSVENGPLIMEIIEKPNKSYWVVVGILSRSSKLACQKSVSPPFTSIGNIMEWVWQTMNDAEKGALPCKSNLCDQNANCINVNEVRYVCFCKQGYTGDGTLCSELPPLCKSNPCNPKASCQNKGTTDYLCTCNSGYTGDGFTCTAPSPCSKSCGGGRKIARTECVIVGFCSTVFERCNTQLCPQDMKEVIFVTKQFKKTVAMVSPPTSRNTNDNEQACEPNNHLDHNGRIRMIGTSCPSARVRRGVGEDESGPKKSDETKRDVLFLIDESGSVGEDSFAKFLGLVKAIVKGFCGDVDIGEDKTRVSVVTFDSIQHDHIDFINFYEKQKLITAIGNIKYSQETGTSTCIVESLTFVRDKMFTAMRGARMSDLSTDKVIFFLSDGCETCLSSDISKKLKSIKSRFKEQRISIIIFFVGNPSSECMDHMQILIDEMRCNQAFIMHSWDQVEASIHAYNSNECLEQWVYDTTGC